MIKASERDTREWREIVAAVDQHVHDILAPVTEGYANLPAAGRKELELVLSHLYEFDSAMAKIDGQSGAVGAKYELVRVER